MNRRERGRRRSCYYALAPASVWVTPQRVKTWQRLVDALTGSYDDVSFGSLVGNPLP